MKRSPTNIRPPADTTGEGRGFLDNKAFDALVQNHGYLNVIIDKALDCPCRVKNSGENLSRCKNCGGSGVVYINRFQSTVVIQSMNQETKYKTWTESMMGMARITSRNVEELTMGDRVTVPSIKMSRLEVCWAYEKVNNPGEWYFKLNYIPVDIVYLFYFRGPDESLGVMDQENIRIEDTWLIITELPEDIYQEEGSPTFAIRYRFNPTYIVTDNTRAGITAPNQTDQGIQYENLPIYVVARLAHFLADEGGVEGEPDSIELFDNSIDPGCLNSPTGISGDEC